MEIRANKPHFEPRRAIVVTKSKKRRKPFTTLKKQRLDPSYVPIPTTDESKARLRAYWVGKEEEHVAKLQDLRSRDVRYDRRQIRAYHMAIYKKLYPLRTCSSCKEQLARNLFDYRDHKKAGASRKSYCFKCRKVMDAKYYDANRDKKLEKTRIHYEQNKDRRKAQFKINYIRRAYGVIATLDESNTICLPNGIQIPFGERVTKRQIQS